MQKDIEIRKGDIETVVQISKNIPEFHNPHPVEEYQRRLTGQLHLCLIAYQDNQVAGFKVGYSKGDYFYSWMGGILPEFRRMGIAAALMFAQHQWAKQQGFKGVEFKTRNGLKPMLLFGIKSGFDIIGLDKRSNVAEHRILLRKTFK